MTKPLYRNFREDYVPTDAEDFYLNYEKYIRSTLSRMGCQYNDLDDMTSEIITRFITNNYMSIYDPARGPFSSLVTWYARTAFMGIQGKLKLTRKRESSFDFQTSFSEDYVGDYYHLETIEDTQATDSMDRFESLQGVCADVADLRAYLLDKTVVKGGDAGMLSGADIIDAILEYHATQKVARDELCVPEALAFKYGMSYNWSLKVWRRVVDHARVYAGLPSLPHDYRARATV